MAALTRHYMQGGRVDQTDLPDQKAIVIMLAQCACNNHTICDDELRPIGVGLFPTGALINHSCTPNAMQSFRQQQVTFKALQPIVPGAEITISYIELAATHAERRQQLSEQYYFDINHDLQAHVSQVTPHQHCSSASGSADAYLQPPHHLDPADHHLTTACMVSGRASADAHIMVLTTATLSHAQQDSFPCSDGPDLQDDDDDDFGPSSTLPAAPMAAPSSSSSLSPSSRSLPAALTPQPAPEQVHVQCWGEAFVGFGQQQLLTLSQHMSEMVSLHRQSIHALDTQSPDKAKTLALSALQLADHMPAPVKALGVRHIWRMRVYEALLRSCIESGNDWIEALSIGCKLVPIYDMVYPKVWPNKGLHFAMLAKVSALLERNQEAIEYANKALQQLQYTHADSPVVEEVRQIMFEAGRSHQDMF